MRQRFIHAEAAEVVMVLMAVVGFVLIMLSKAPVPSTGGAASVTVNHAKALR